MTLGARLKKARNRRGLTQVFVARTLGIDRSTYAHWERNTSEPSTEHLSKLARLFKCSVDDLLGVEPTDRRRTFEDIADELREQGLTEHDIAHILEIVRLRRIQRANTSTYDGPAAGTK